MAAIPFALLFPPYSILNSTISCSQQPWLSPAFTATTRPSVLVSTKFGSTSFLSGSSIICVRKLWSMLARNPLDSLFCCVAPSADVRVVKVPPWEPGPVTDAVVIAVCKGPLLLPPPDHVACSKNSQHVIVSSLSFSPETETPQFAHPLHTDL